MELPKYVCGLVALYQLNISSGMWRRTAKPFVSRPYVHHPNAGLVAVKRQAGFGFKRLREIWLILEKDPLECQKLPLNIVEIYIAIYRVFRTSSHVCIYTPSYQNQYVDSGRRYASICN